MRLSCMGLKGNSQKIQDRRCKTQTNKHLSECKSIARGKMYSKWFLSYLPRLSHLGPTFMLIGSPALLYKTQTPLWLFIYITKAAAAYNPSLLSAKTDFIPFRRNILFRGMSLYPICFWTFTVLGMVFLIVSQVFFFSSHVLTIMFLFLMFWKHQIDQE